MVWILCELPNQKFLLSTRVGKPASNRSAPPSIWEPSMETLNFLPSVKEKLRALDEFVEMNSQPLAWAGVYWSQHYQQWCDTKGTLIVEETVRQGFGIPSQVYHTWWHTHTSSEWRMWVMKPKPQYYKRPVRKWGITCLIWRNTIFPEWTEIVTGLTRGEVFKTVQQRVRKLGFKIISCTCQPIK